MSTQVTTETYRGWNGEGAKPGDIIERWVQIRYYRGIALISSGSPVFEARFEYVGRHSLVPDASLIRQVSASGKDFPPFLIQNKTLRNGESVIASY